MPQTNKLLKQALTQGLFDANWYTTRYKLAFANPVDAFNDYLRKSSYSDISPSPNFDGCDYLRRNHDVYIAGIPPLQHYIQEGAAQGRSYSPLQNSWTPSTQIAIENRPGRRTKTYAVVLHIFYADFVQRFYDALYGVDFDFDLFVTSTDDDILKLCNAKFRKSKNVKKITTRLVPNKGRNFGPFLVEFGKALLEYDIFLHMHSKKSLYSGKEQLQWANYLVEFLVKDKQIMSQGLDILEQTDEYGLYYPTSFWNLPPWVNHWLQNKGLGRHLLRNEFGIDQQDEFFAYPVGGMFWAKTAAMKDLLARAWSYEDFPAEPLPADGSQLHALERMIPFFARNRGFNQFFYDPASGSFTADTTFIFKTYATGNHNAIKASIARNEIISFDIFDTIVKRDVFEPDYAKFLLPQRAGLKITGHNFVDLRNNAELNIRKRRNFTGDVEIFEIYEDLIHSLDTSLTATELAELEFQIDLEMLQGKPVMVTLANDAARAGKKLYFISDTYYSRQHIQKILEKAGIIFPYELFISSELGLRKDSGTIWEMIDERLVREDTKSTFLHIGDNVCSDSQNPGDRGIQSFHILAPLDKWDALGLPYIRDKFSIQHISNIKKWGPVLSHVGANPFI